MLALSLDGRIASMVKADQALEPSRYGRPAVSRTRGATASEATARFTPMAEQRPCSCSLASLASTRTRPWTVGSIPPDFDDLEVLGVSRRPGW